MNADELKEQEKYERCLKDIEALVFQSGVVFQKMERDLHRRDGFSSSQTYLMSILFERGPAGCRMGEIGRLMNLEKSSVTRLVDNLVRDGMVSKVSDVDDKRAMRAVLTDKGRDAAQALRAGRRAFYSRLIGKLPRGHVREVMDGFSKLVKALDNKDY